MLALEHIPGDLAVLIQLSHRHNLLMSGHLEHAVGRGIHNQRAGAHMLLAVVLEHLGAGVGGVADHLAAGTLFKLLDDFRRKAVGIGGQSTLALHTRNLPVADGGVLAVAGLLQAGTGAQHLCRGLTAGHAVQIEQAHLLHIRGIERLAGGDGRQGIGAHITKFIRIRLGAYAEAVQYY